MVGAHPVYSRPEFADSSVPLPTTRAPPNRTPTRTGPSLRRGKTLTRPERSVPAAPLIKPPAPLAPGQPAAAPVADSFFDPWTLFSYAITFWAPAVLLSSLAGMKTQSVRQAWREKVALCFIALVLGGVIGFLTVGLDRTLCPESSQVDSSRFIRIGSTPGILGINGYAFNISVSTPINGVDFYSLAAKESGSDITSLFTRSTTDFPSCNGLSFKIATDSPCPNSNTSCPLGSLSQSTFSSAHITNTSSRVGFDWDNVANTTNQFVLDGTVLDMTPYMALHSSAVANDPVDHAIRSLLTGSQTKSGKDASRLFYTNNQLVSSVDCLRERYAVGNIDKLTPGCFISNLILYAGLFVILSLVLARWIMAVVFYWFLSDRLIQPPKNLSRTVISPSVMPEGANMHVNNTNGTAPWANKAAAQQKGAKGKPSKLSPSQSATTLTSSGSSNTVAPQQTISMAQIGAELFTVCLVTCYSEGEESLRTTLDSISNTTYSDERKLLFVVADGMVTGAGEKMSTPDICVGLLEADPRFGTPQPMSYIAVGSGPKKENRAMVYAGHYCKSGRRTPTVIVVKCGTDAEALKDKKPGNRGKRDGQLILMNFFSRVTYNDRMTPLDFDLFRKIQTLMGVTPDYFEACLMVDADTKVMPDSLTHLVNALHHDNFIMGACGETRIANKRQSWVTAIQVYEYFISHHLAKAFESVFGGVTCLPGCFSMYRLKARKANDDDWVPLIVHPDIVREYSQSEVSTLHQKNLLLLGEDRFLTTILLRTFPNRKMMFIPQARCRTVAPDTFSVLLSQRRRWINSTIHNLMELVQVRNLCGTFCFSMQFVVFMDLIGTVVLPIAIGLTYSLIVNTAITPPKSFAQAIPLMLLVAVLGLPGLLILVTTRKVVYVAWMLVYLAALPIWNFVLPVYSFWHFDDFSWGETRKVAGEAKDLGHGGDAEGAALAHVPLRRWEDWERSRLKKLRREDKRRNNLNRNFPGGYYDADGFLRDQTQSQFFEGGTSDTTSIVSSVDEDKWGGQIGGYNENNPSFPPPPVTLLHPQAEVLQNAQVVGMDELEAMLDQGFEPPMHQNSYDSSIPPVPALNRYQLSERSANSSPSRIPHGQQGPPFDAFGPLSPSTGGREPMAPRMRELSPPPTNGAFAAPPPLMTTPYGVSTATDDGKGHVRKRSNGGEQSNWGPMGPLGSNNGLPPTPRSNKRI